MHELLNQTGLNHLQHPQTNTHSRELRTSPLMLARMSCWARQWVFIFEVESFACVPTDFVLLCFNSSTVEGPLDYGFRVILSAINQGSGLPTQREREGHCDQKSRATARRMILRRRQVTVRFSVSVAGRRYINEKPARPRTFSPWKTRRH